MERFVILAHSVHGAACGQLIHDATSAKGCYGFNSLLGVPNIQRLKEDPTHSKVYRLLELFAYGTYTAYRDSKHEYPALSPTQLFKLRQLSIVSMAMKQRHMDVASLMSTLELDSAFELENLVIDAMDHGLFSCKLDQKNGKLMLRGLKGRDVRVETDMARIIQQLDAWLNGTDGVLERIDAIVRRLQESDATTHAMQEDFDAKVHEMTKALEEKKESKQEELSDVKTKSRKAGVGKRLRK